MGKRITLGKRECILIIINLICAKIFLNFPREFTEKVGTAGWMLTLYVTILVLVVYFLISKLYKGFEGLDLLDIGEKISGGFGRIFTGSVVILFLVYITAVVLREFAENMKTVAFTNSPISFILLLFIISMIIGAFLGIEAIAGIHALIVPVIIIGYLVVIAGVLPQADFSNLQPIFGTGYSDIFVSGASKISTFSELLILFFLFPHMSSGKRFKSVGYISIIISAFLLLLSVAMFIVTIPYPTALESFLPIYHISRIINFGRLFQRIEALFLVIWASSGLLYLTINFYFIVDVFKKSFKLKYRNPLIFPFAIIVFCLSLLPPNLPSAVVLETNYFRSYSWLVSFLFVLILLCIAAVVKKRKQDKNRT